jgi:predicted AAA+ superfamily ATPase
MIAVENLIAEWQSRPLPAVVRRDLDIKISGKTAAAVVGMRRSGKTFRLYQEMQQLLAQGVKKNQLLYINFDDERLFSEGEIDSAFLNELMESYFRLNPEVRSRETYFFFDEIQEIKGWARFCRRLIDTENVKLYLSGSSAKLLSREIATEVRGRSLPFELLPFSFREYIRFRKMNEEPGPLERSLYEKALNDYLLCGGFPDVFPQGNPEVRINFLQNYADTVVLRDVLDRHNLSNVRGALELTHILLASNASTVSVQRLSNKLGGRNISMSREMVSQICSYLQDSFLLFFVPLFSSNLQKVKVNPQKVYAVDPGMAAAMLLANQTNLDQRLEEVVYLELRRRHPHLREGGISYYLTRDKNEIDFILGDRLLETPEALYQVSVSLKDKKTRAHELEPLETAMRETGLKEASVITAYERETIKTEAGKIEVFPAWEWLLKA